MTVTRRTTFLLVGAAVAATVAGLALGRNPAQPPQAVSPSSSVAWGHATKGTVLLFHGLFGAPADMAKAPFAELVRGLVAQGWRVESVPLPEDGSPNSRLEDWLRERPASYLARWLAELGRRMPTGPVVFGGVSWGGWHAIEAALHLRCVAWFAISPVTQISYVAELHETPVGVLDIARLPNERGFVDWGTADDRVGWQHTKRLVAAARHVRGVQLDGMGHTTTPAVVADVLRWMRGVG